jgi:S1/P1 Nuclease
MVRIAALGAATLLLYSPSAFAWGGLAHEVVCEIAFLELNDTARQRVIELIQQEEEFRSFRASCNWPDRPPRKRTPEHFVNVPRNMAEIGEDECPLGEKCVVTAIEDDFAVLASSDATDEEKLEALKFLGHWVGDVHQPLHVSFEDDRGGNRVKTQGSSCDTLHAVWDRCLVEERLGMHPVALAAELRADITDEQRAEWLATDAVAWANESLTIAASPDVEYCVMVDGACQYEAENRELDDGEPEKKVLVANGYLDTHAPVVRERMVMAGVRLGGLLNRALGAQTPETSLRTEMLGRIETISRELDELRNAIEAIKP